MQHDVIDSAASRRRIWIVDLMLPDATGKAIITELSGARATESNVLLQYAGLDDFDIQKRAFLSISENVLSAYAGRYVVSRNGSIEDSDENLPTLTHRFFDRHGLVSVYITQIKPLREVIIDTPFFD